MNLDDLEKKIASAVWFCHLGSFVEHDGFIPITDQQAWHDYTTSCLTSELGPPAAHIPQMSSDLNTLERMEWLPSSQSDADPFHGDDLHGYIAAQGETAALRGNRLRLTKLLMMGLRGLEPNGWLRFGPTDYTEAARQSLIFAVRMAVAEIMAQQHGVWCECVNIYVGGNWPCGRLADGQIVVI